MKKEGRENKLEVSSKIQGDPAKLSWNNGQKQQGKYSTWINAFEDEKLRTSVYDRKNHTGQSVGILVAYMLNMS